MKIIQVTPRYPPHTGGVETHVSKISERLVGRGHDVTVFAADADGNTAHREVKNGVLVRRFRGFAPRGSFHVAPSIATAVRREDPDVVHAHNYHSLPVFFAGLGVTDARFVVTPHYHGGSSNGLRDLLLSIYHPVGKWTLRRADEVIAVSEWEYEILLEDFGVQGTVIPNGLDIVRFAESKPMEHDRPYLLCVGRLEEYKGVQHVIRMLPELPEYDLLVAGEGGFKPQLERISHDVGVSDRVKFLGFVDEERLPRLYAGASAYLLLSAFEAFGLTVAEAVASGTPVVVRTGSALDDWTTRDDCMGVSNMSPVEIATAVKQVRNSESTPEQLCSWEDAVNRLLTVFGKNG